MPVTIDTTTTTTALAKGGRRLARHPDGTLFVAFWATTGSIEVWASGDNGATWANKLTIAGTWAQALAIFATVDGAVFILYNGAPHHYSWAAGALTLVSTAPAPFNDNTGHGGDLVAFPNEAEFGGWIVAAVGFSGGAGFVVICNYQNATWAVRQPQQIEGGGIDVTDLALDFHHTGDGKTIQGGTPHLYVSWRYDNDVYFRRFAYAPPNWTMGPQRIIYSAVYTYWWYTAHGGAFDGTRYVMARVAMNGHDIYLYERDANDLATTELGFVDSPSGLIVEAIALTVDPASGDVVLTVVDDGNDQPHWCRWSRQTAEFGAWTTIAAETVTEAQLVANRHAYAGLANGTRVDAVWQQDLATDAIRHEIATTLSTAPTAPAWSYPTDGSVADVNQQLALGWVFNDLDPGDAQSAYTVRRRIGAGAYNYWNGTAWATSESGATKIVTGTSALTLSANWGSDSQADHYYAVKTWDSVDQVSAWSDELRITPSAKDNPTITTPASDGYDIPTRNFSVVWTVATQTKYRLRVLGDSAGNPDPTVIEYDSGIVIDAAARTAVASFPTNSVVRHIELTAWNDEGLASSLTYRRVDVAWTPPATPTLTLNADDTVPDAIVVDLDNPAGGATVASNDIYRRIVGDTSAGIRIATLVAVDGGITDYAVAHLVQYEYRVQAISTDGATAWSAWEDGIV